MGSWWRRWASVRALGVVGFWCLGLVACESDDLPGADSGGSAGSTGTSGSSGKGGRAGSTSGGGGTGGRAGANAGSAGKASGGSTSGTSGSAGTDGSGGAWDAACNGVSNNGRCTGNVYEWCDYFSGSVMQLDCAPLGMTCRAESQPNEPETNGCVGEPCATGADEHCDGQLRYDCQASGQIVIDCKKQRGPATECEVFEGSARCVMNHPCSAPNTSWCEGNLHVICTEDSTLYYQDCQRKSESGRCVTGAIGANCDTSLL